MPKINFTITTYLVFIDLAIFSLIYGIVVRKV